MKDHLIFDVTDANTILDSDSVGAFLRASDGTLLTHTDVGGKKALDVNVASGINVEVDLSHVDDSVALGDGTNLLTSTTIGADIGLDVNIINASIAVTATDLDIRDLSAASDSVASWTNDGSGNAIGSHTGALDVYLTNAITVNDAALADTAILASADTLAAAGTAEKVVASNLANRKYLFLYNNDNRKMYIGGSTVDKDAGFPLSPGAYLELRAGASVDVYYDSEKSGSEIRVLELS